MTTDRRHVRRFHGDRGFRVCARRAGSRRRIGWLKDHRGFFFGLLGVPSARRGRTRKQRSGGPDEPVEPGVAASATGLPAGRTRPSLAPKRPRGEAAKTRSPIVRGYRRPDQLGRAGSAPARAGPRHGSSTGPDRGAVPPHTRAGPLANLRRAATRANRRPREPGHPGRQTPSRGRPRATRHPEVAQFKADHTRSSAAG